MKKYLLLMTFVLVGITGCNSINKELLVEMQEYVDFNGEACIYYVNADATLVRT